MAQFLELPASHRFSGAHLKRGVMRGAMPWLASLAVVGVAILSFAGCRSTNPCDKRVQLPSGWSQKDSKLTEEEAAPIIDVATRFIMKRCRAPLGDLTLVAFTEHDGLPAVHILRTPGLSKQPGPGPYHVSGVNATYCIAVVDPRRRKVVEFWTVFP